MRLHKDYQGSREFRPCKFQRVFQRENWMVDPRHSQLHKHHDRDAIIRLLSKLDERDEKDPEDGKITKPLDHRLVSPLLLKLGWGDIIFSLDAKRLATLGNLGPGPQDHAYWPLLRILNKRYFKHVRRKVSSLDFTIRCWLNTPEGCV